MTFLAPAMAWWGLLAVPVVAFYLAGRRPRRAVVSAVMFWALGGSRLRAEGGWWKIRKWVSLALQLLVLGCIVAALSEPSGTGKPGATIYVLDASASMRAGSPPRFERAKTALAAELSRRAGAPSAVILSGETPAVISGWTKHAAPGLLDRIQASARAISPDAALSLASDLALDTGARIIFFTDRVWDGKIPPVWPEGVEIRDFSSPAENAGITRFSARRSPLVPEEVWLHAEAVSGNATLELTRDGKLADARAVTGNFSGEWSFHAPGASRFVVRLVGGGPDAMPADDSAEVEIPARGTVEAIAVAPPDLFLDAALAAVPGLETVRLWPPAALRYGDLRKLWIFQGAEPPPDFQYGGLVLVNPASDGFWGKRIGEMTNPLVTSADAESPPLRGTGMGDIAVASASGFDPPAGAHVYLSSAGRPLIYGDWSRPPRWVVLAFDPAASDMVSRTAFPIFFANLVDAMRGGEEMIDSGASDAATRLVPLDAPSAAGEKFPGISLWWWLAATAAALLLIEWALFQRGTTE